MRVKIGQCMDGDSSLAATGARAYRKNYVEGYGLLLYLGQGKKVSISLSLSTRTERMIWALSQPWFECERRIEHVSFSSASADCCGGGRRVGVFGGRQHSRQRWRSTFVCLVSIS